MIISRTPFRVSLFGGGTDYPAWYKEHGGAVLSCSIDKYCFVSARWRPPFFPEKHRIVWSEIELQDSLDAIRHPAVRATLKRMVVQRGVEIHHFADLPSRTGLGSSSAFTVGLLNALLTLRGKQVSQAALAKEAIYIEQQALAETVGIQDQIQTAHGGLNYVKIEPSGEYSLQPLVLPLRRMQDFQAHLMLYFTGTIRHASTVAEAQVASIARGERDSELHVMAKMAKQAVDILTGDRNLSEIGFMLHSAWALKRSLSTGVSTAEVDTIYARALEAGALGGKLLGAGGGGFMLIFARPEQQPAVREALRPYLEVPFKIEYSGSRIIYGGQEFAG